MLFILFAIGKKFSFPTFFWLRYCELVTQQLRVFDGCFHANYIAWQLKLNHWFCSNQKTNSLISTGTPPLNLLKPKLCVYIVTIWDECQPSWEFVDFVARFHVILDPSTAHISCPLWKYKQYKKIIQEPFVHIVVHTSQPQIRNHCGTYFVWKKKRKKKIPSIIMTATQNNAILIASVWMFSNHRNSNR